MNISLIYLKLKDFFSWLKFPAHAGIVRIRIFKRNLSRQLRRNSQIRCFLNLPVVEWKDFLVWCSSNPCNDQWIPFESSCSFQHCVPRINRWENRWFFDENATAKLDSSGLVVLHDAYVHGHNGGQYLNVKKEYLWDLGRENWKYFDAFFMDSALRLPRPQRISGSVAMLADEYAYNNFSHWVFDVMPKVHLLVENNLLNSIDYFVVGHSSKKYQLNTLCSLGIPKNKIIQLNRHSFFQADKLLIPRLGGYNRQTYAPWMLRFLEQTFSQKKKAIPTRKLFISRSDAAFRRLIGEDELITLLERDGFELITLDGLPLQDTVDLFAQAKVVVGPFGSGLMNIAFCQEKTAVVEIVTPAFYNCYHWYMSGVRKLSHAVYFGDSGLLDRSKPPNQLTKDIFIDVEDCYQFIKMFLDDHV